MAKTLSIAVIIISVALCLLPSCKKCYNCVNTCSICLKKDTAGNIIESQELYSDSTYYATLLKTLTTDSGYTCTATKSTYSVDFCVNTKSGANQYLPYYEGDGRYTCSPK